MNKNCSNCNFFDHYVDPNNDVLMMECRRYPPQVMIGEQIGLMNHREIFSIWPTVKENDWCGEWNQNAN